MTDTELYEKRGAAVKQMQEIVDKAEQEKRCLNSEEREQWDKMDAEQESISETLQRRKKQASTTKNLEQLEQRQSQPAEPGAAEKRGRYQPQAEQSSKNFSEALRGWLLAGTDQRPTENQYRVAEQFSINLDRQRLDLQLWPSDAFRVTPGNGVGRRKKDFAHYEVRALGTPVAAGGYTIPQGFVNTVEMAMLTYGGMREVSRIVRTEGVGALPIATANDTNQKGAILAENTQVTEQDIVFAQVVLDAYKYTSKMVRVSIELIQDSGVDIEGVVGGMLGERIGRITNEHFTTGTGTGMPRGVVPAASTGVTGAAGSATTISYDNLVALIHTVDPYWRNNARFMFHDTTLRALKQMKDSQNRPLWLPSMIDGEPDRVFGFPYTINQDMPVMAANAKSILFGDFSTYWIRDVMPVTLMRLDERFADFAQVAFLAFSRHDGDLVDPGGNAMKLYINSAT